MLAKTVKKDKKNDEHVTGETRAEQEELREGLGGGIKGCGETGWVKRAR